MSERNSITSIQYVLDILKTIVKNDTKNEILKLFMTPSTTLPEFLNQHLKQRFLKKIFDHKELFLSLEETLSPRSLKTIIEKWRGYLIQLNPNNG